MKAAVQLYQPALVPMLSAFQDDGYTDRCPDQFKPLLVSLAKNSPVCGLIPPFPRLLNLLTNLAQGHKIEEVGNIIYLRETVPVLAQIGQYPDFLQPILERVVSIVTAPLKEHNLSELEGECCCSAPELGYFPTLRQCGHRGMYMLDNKTQEQPCTKRGGKHPTLSPGLFTLSCSHGEDMHTFFEISEHLAKGGQRHYS